ncbi:palmitoyltransferase pfa5 [Trapelia coarctata]|nr:palmitoyltransferase pfa5 [Trapelia coarctata]
MIDLEIRDRAYFNVVLLKAAAGFFGLFTLGMSLTALQFVFINSTAVENLSRKVKVWTLAVHIPRPQDLPAQKPFQTVTYSSASSPNSTSAGPLRTFAILHTNAGENPFDLGYYGNFKSVMGYTVFDWFFPLKYSPCTDHTSQESDFQLGPVVQRLREEAGIALPSGNNEKDRRRRHKNPRRSSAGDGRHEYPARAEVLNNPTTPPSDDAILPGIVVKAGNQATSGHQPPIVDGPMLANGHIPEDQPGASSGSTLANGHVPGNAAVDADYSLPPDEVVH